MSRLIVAKEAGPFKIEAGSPQPQWICRCGLSKNGPFCDGSHTRTRGERAESLYLYSDLTQRQIDITAHSKVLGLQTTSSEAVIYDKDGLEIWKMDITSPLMERVYDIRRSGGSKQVEDEYDGYSDIYLLKVENAFCATLRVTQARDGRLDCEAFYPAEYLGEQARLIVGSASRLYKIPGSLPKLEYIRTFIREVWRDQYHDGMRVDLINAALPMVRYYERIGYRVVGEEFVHPRVKTRSRVMIAIIH